MRALETQNLNVQFDWDALHDTPPPLLSAEPWRERRRAERAARQLRDADEETEATGLDLEPAAREAPIDPLELLEDEPPVESPILVVETVQASPISSDTAVASPGPAGAAEGPASGRRRRRHRRRGRGGRPEGPPEASGSEPLPTESAVTSSTERDHPESPDDEE
jgi:hypothetical protein